MFKLLLELVFSIVILLTLITQIFMPMFSDLEFFWLFKKEKIPKENLDSNVDINQAVDRLAKNTYKAKIAHKQSIQEVDSVIDTLRKAKEE